MPTLIASPIGLQRIRQARSEKGWGWSTDDDDSCLIIASHILDPGQSYEPGGPYANGISGGTWKRFLAGQHPIRASAFKAYCQALGLDWRDIVVRDNAPTDTRYQDWGEAPEVPGFCGRLSELEQLEQWLTADRCRLVGVLGMAGIGKTSVIVKMAERVQSQFGALIYRSLQSAPPIEDVLSELIEFLSNQEAPSSDDVDAQLSVLMDCLRDRRCLIILDDAETVLQGGQLVGQYREGYESYGSLLRRIGGERHQSCLVVISREQPREVAAVAGPDAPVRELRLQGLSMQDGRQILELSGLVSRGSAFEALMQRYRGNPSALKVVSKIIQEFFGGDIIQFMSQSTVFVSDVVVELLAQQISRLSGLEIELMYWLAIACQPISLSELKDNLWKSVSLNELLGALQSLQRRSLIEKAMPNLAEEDVMPEGNETIFTLQPVVMKYVTNQFIERSFREIQTLTQTHDLNHLGVLRSHALVKDPGDPDDLRPVQVRLILNRVRDRLYGSMHPAQVKTGLTDLLENINQLPPNLVGYAEKNIQVLLDKDQSGDRP